MELAVLAGLAFLAFVVATIVPLAYMLIMIVAGGVLYFASPEMSVGEVLTERAQKVRQTIGTIGKVISFVGMGLIAAKIVLSIVGGWSASDTGRGQLEVGRSGVYRSY